MNTTLAKQLANWVILYSPLQMASDMIENYEGHPAFQFFRDFDPDCDESKALAGEPGEFVAIVRKAKGNYFLGAATNEKPRTLEIKLDSWNWANSIKLSSMRMERMRIGNQILRITG